MSLSDLAEVTQETTSDEIAAYADAVAQEVESERQGDTKSDAEIINDVASIETSAEKNASSESAKASSQSEESGDEPSYPEWVDDDVKTEVAAYGISESDLSDFASREELDRALRLLDKTALEVGRKATVEGDSDKSRNDKGQFVKKEEPKPSSSEESSPKSGRYEISLSKDIYDDEIVNEFTRMRDHYESRLEQLESHFMQVSASEEERQFDSYVDSLGHSDLFGKTGSESEKELERRRDLHVAVKAQLIGLERLGRPSELNDKLISRVANMVFADELSKKRLKQQTQKISRQSQLRQGGSPTKPLPPRDNARDEADRLYRELERA
jgi:hypothetical protein